MRGWAWKHSASGVEREPGLITASVTPSEANRAAKAATTS